MTSKISYFLLFIIGSLVNMPFCSAMRTKSYSFEPRVFFKIFSEGKYWNTQEGKDSYNRIIGALKDEGLISYDTTAQKNCLWFEKKELVDNSSHNTNDQSANKSYEISSFKAYKKLGLILSKAHSRYFPWLWDVKFNISEPNSSNEGYKVIPKGPESKVDLNKGDLNKGDLNKGDLAITLLEIKFNTNAAIITVIITVIILVLVSLIGYYLYEIFGKALYVKKTHKKGSPDKSGKKRSAKV